MNPQLAPVFRRRSGLALLALLLAACAGTPDRPAAATAPADAKAGPAADGLSPEDRVAFFVNHARNGECAEVDAGLDQGIGVDQRDSLDQTALIAAVTHNSLDCVRLLLRRGAGTEVADNAGWTPLIYAAYFGAGTALLQELLDHHADIDARNSRGVTALYLASAAGHEEQVAFLLGRGADRSIATQSGYTPLRIAQLKGFAKIQALLSAGARPAERTAQAGGAAPLPNP